MGGGTPRPVSTGNITSASKLARRYPYRCILYFNSDPYGNGQYLAPGTASKFHQVHGSWTTCNDGSIDK
eukprot:6173908-Pleurochrysis_carterae.AAC.2